MEVGGTEVVAVITEVVGTTVGMAIGVIADTLGTTIMEHHIITTMMIHTTTILAVTEVIAVPIGTASALQDGAVVMETIEVV